MSPVMASGPGRLSLSEKTSATPPKASSRPSHLRSDIVSPSRKCAPTRTQNGMVLTRSALRATVVYSSPTKISVNSIPNSSPAAMPGHKLPSRAASGMPR